MAAKSDFEECTTHGPWGGSNGDKWVYKPQRFTNKIKICVKYGNVVDSITFQTDCSNGKPQSSSFGGNKTGTICIDYPSERLMSISGVCSRFDGFDVVSSLTVMTNLNLHGPYGGDGGYYNKTAFSYDVKGEVVAGFHGRANKYLTAIGVYLIPKSLALHPTPTCDCKIKNELFSSMSRMAVTRDAGPWGVVGGKPWDDGVFFAVKQVRVHLGDLNVIYALQFEYLKSDGKSVLSEIRGGTDRSKVELVHLDTNDEFLIGVTGFFGPVEGYNGLEAIVSISFHTNKRIYGPYGEERGKGNVYFSSSPSFGKVVGFHGRSNGFLSAIGVLMEYS